MADRRHGRAFQFRARGAGIFILAMLCCKPSNGHEVRPSTPLLDVLLRRQLRRVPSAA
jgi:hypothetical protein